MTASFREARAWERTSVQEPVVLVLERERHRGLVTRVGGGGVYIETDAPAERGMDILMRMRLPCFGEARTLKGEIRWREPGGIGVMFVDLDPGIRRDIVEFVAEAGHILYVTQDLQRRGSKRLT